jgi:hypothetical protein
MTQLARYEQARFALAECQRVDEVKDIRDKAEAMAAYARQAKDTELVQWATEIKVRAERKAGELLAAMPKSQGAKFNGRAEDGSFRQSHDDSAQTLAEVGVTAVQSSRWQSLASMTDAHFETAVATAKETAGQVTTAFMLREAARAKPQGQAPKGAKADAIREELKAAKERGVSQLETYARLTLSALRTQDSFTEQEQSLLAELMDVIAAMTAESKAKP